MILNRYASVERLAHVNDTDRTHQADVPGMQRFAGRIQSELQGNESLVSANEALFLERVLQWVYSHAAELQAVEADLVYGTSGLSL